MKASYLNIYNEYCSRQANQVAMVDRLTKESSDVRQFLKRQLRHKRCRNLDLCSFLIMPLQRLCKYPLLVKELVASTPKNHVEYSSLKRAEDLIGTVSSLVVLLAARTLSSMTRFFSYPFVLSLPLAPSLAHILSPTH